MCNENNTMNSEEFTKEEYIDILESMVFGAQAFEKLTKCQRHAISYAAEQLKKTEELCSCELGLEEDDTIYQRADWDGGIRFDYIRNIKYCPLCGKKLPVERDC